MSTTAIRDNRIHNALTTTLDTLDDMCERLIKANMLAMDPPEYESRDVPTDLLELAEEVYRYTRHIRSRLRDDRKVTS